jgi:glycosyltransferase involved in cell wall biosynthesis
VRVVHVVPHINEEASGPSYSVPRLCQSLAANGHDIELMCLAAKNEVAGVRISTFKQWNLLRRFAISSTFPNAIRNRGGIVDIVHNHSLWAMPNVVTGLVVPGSKARLVTSPRGTLSRWAMARSRRVKQVIWPLQRRVLFAADLLHATSDEEYLDIRRAGLRTPVAIIANGVDLPPAADDMRRGGLRTLLYLGRVHPVKGIDLLLAAWGELQGRHPGWRLVIAGRGEPTHVHATQQLAERLALERVEFTGPVYGAAKSETYRAADLFVLPSHTENFGMVVAEALTYGVPAIVSRNAPWQGLVANDCGWWTENSKDALSEVLHEAMSLDAHVLKEMGHRGREWMRNEFSWESIGRKMSESYRWLVGGGMKPPWVRED